MANQITITAVFKDEVSGKVQTMTGNLSAATKKAGESVNDLSNNYQSLASNVKKSSDQAASHTNKFAKQLINRFFGISAVIMAVQKTLRFLTDSLKEYARVSGDNTLKRLSGVFMEIKTTIGAALMPALTMFTDWLTRNKEEVLEWAVKTVNIFTQTAMGLGSTLKVATANMRVFIVGVAMSISLLAMRLTQVTITLDEFVKKMDWTKGVLGWSWITEMMDKNIARSEKRIKLLGEMVGDQTKQMEEAFKALDTALKGFKGFDYKYEPPKINKKIMVDDIEEAARVQKLLEADIKEISDKIQAEIDKAKQQLTSVSQSVATTMAELEEDLVMLTLKGEEEQITAVWIAADKRIEATRSEYDELISLAKQLGMSTIEIEQDKENAIESIYKIARTKHKKIVVDNYADIERAARDAAEAQQQINIDMVKNEYEKWSQITDAVLGAIATISNAIKSAYSYQLEVLDQETQDRIDNVNKTTKSEKIKQREIAKIEADAAEERKEIRRKELEATLVTAIANTAAGFAKALEQGGVYGLITGAAVAAAGAIEIGIISDQLSKLAGGGVIPGQANSGDKNLVMANSGEMVLNNAQQRRLLDIASGTASPDNVSIQMADTIIVHGNLDRAAARQISMDRERQLTKLKDDLTELKYRGQLKAA